MKQRAVGELKGTYRHCGRTDADPRAVRWVDVDEVEHAVATRFESHGTGRHFEVTHHPDTVRFADYGDVVAGEWDRECVPVTEYSEWDLVVARFVEGKDWEEISLYEDCLERFRRGRQIWGCSSESELRERFAYLDRLKESIESRGYRRDGHLADSVGTESVDSGEPDEVIVDIGRDGELLHYTNGRHRLALADVCDVDEIPVVVRVRHREWQELRERIRSADSDEQLSERDRRHLDHPDLRDVAPE